MKKSDCEHRWRSVGKRGVIDKCDDCGDVYPCRENCGHIDCHLEKSRKCHVCGEVIHGRNTVLYFLDGPGVKGYPVHKECADYAYYVIL